MNIAARDAYYRIARQVKRMERVPVLDESSLRAQPRPPGELTIMSAVAGPGGVPAFAGSTCGRATVTLQYTDPDTGAVTNGPTVTATNRMTSAVGANKGLYVGYGGGCWFVITEAC